MIIFTVNTPLREITLSLTILFLGFSFQFVVMFLYKWYNQSIRKINDSNFLWSLLLVFINLQQIFFIMSDFYVSGPARLRWIDLGYLSIGAGIILFIFLQEKALPFNSHYVFTMTSILLLGLLVILPRGMQIVLVIPQEVVIVILFLIFLNYVIKTSSKYEKKQFALFTLGVVLFAIGDGLKSDFIASINVIFYTIGTIFLLAGIILGNYALLKLPGFTEIGWSKAIKEIFVIHESGVPLLHAKFENGKIKKTAIDTKDFLASGIMTAIQSAISEILESQKSYMTVDRGDYKVFLRKDRNILMVVFSEKAYITIHNKMQLFINRFYNLFGDKLESKPRDLSPFQIGYSIMKGIFKEERD